MNKFVAALFAAFLATAAYAEANGPAVITFPAKNGTVTFPHRAHQERLKDCKTCHATAAGGKIEGFGKDKAHALCRACHEKEKKGPTKCTDCHKKA